MMDFKKYTPGRTDRIFQMPPISFERGSGIQMDPFKCKG